MTASFVAFAFSAGERVIHARGGVALAASFLAMGVNPSLKPFDTIS